MLVGSFIISVLVGESVPITLLVEVEDGGVKVRVLVGIYVEVKGGFIVIVDA